MLDDGVAPGREPVLRKVFLCTTFDLCQSNAYLGTQIRELFNGGASDFVSDPADADLIIVTTCAFDQERETRGLDRVRELARDFGGDKRIVVTGCLPKIAEALAAIPGIETIDPLKLDDLVDRFGLERHVKDVEANVLDPDLAGEQFREGFHVQICTGCINACSYCAIRKAKGTVRSKPIDDILVEIRRGHEAGHRLFVLLADDCGSYGVDIGTDLATLITEIDRLGLADLQLDLHYIYPRWFIKLYEKIDKRLFRLFRLMTISLQTVSPALLKRMNRSYDVDLLLAMVRHVRSINPSCELRTQIMYGFPGSDREVLRRCISLREVFHRVQYFFFTDRKIVPSHTLDGKVPRVEMLHRAWTLFQEMLVEQKQGRRITDLGNDFNATAKSIVKNNTLDQVDVLLIKPGRGKPGAKALPLPMLAVAERLLQRQILVRLVDERVDPDPWGQIESTIANNRLIAVGICAIDPAEQAYFREVRDRVRSLTDVPIVLGLPSLPDAARGASDGNGRHGATFTALVERLRSAPGSLRGHVYEAGDWTGPSEPQALLRLDRFNRLPFYLLAEYLEAYGLSFSAPLTGEDLRFASTFCVLRPGQPEEMGNLDHPAYWMVE